MSTNVQTAQPNLKQIAAQFSLPAALLNQAQAKLRKQSATSLSNLAARAGKIALYKPGVSLQKVSSAALKNIRTMHPKLAFPRCFHLCGHHYDTNRLDLGAGAPGGIKGLFNKARRSAAKFERLLQTNPQLRANFEKMIGGKYVPDGRNDGKISIRRHHHGCGNHHALPNAKAAQSIAQFIGGMAKGPFGPQALAGLIGKLDRKGGGHCGPHIHPPHIHPPHGHQKPGTGEPTKPTPTPTPAPAQPPAPSKPEAGSTDDISAVLANPNMTVEDKIALMLQLIMKKMDDQILAQGQNVEAMQAKSDAAAKKEKEEKAAKETKKTEGGSKAGDTKSPTTEAPTDAPSQPSVDHEVFKLKRMVEKRSQMFDMLRQIVDKYNRTAQGVIQSMGR